MKRWHQDALRIARRATDALEQTAIQLERLNDLLETMSEDDEPFDNPEDFENPVVVPPEVYRQLSATRESGAVNMITEIKSGLRQLEFDEALDWLNNNTNLYMEGVMDRGFAPRKEDDDE